jgi:EpsI family protein
MKSRSPSMRFLVAFILLAGTAVYLQARGRTEVIAMRQPLSTFPHTIGQWTGSDFPIEPEVLQVLGDGDFLLRVYRSTPGTPYVDLFIAYFPTQRTGEAIHSPRNCLPGAGWSPIQAKRIQVSVPGREPFLANRYLIAKGTERRLVLYWYQSRNRSIASEYWAKFYLVADSVRLHRSDGALIRITTPLPEGEKVEDAQSRLLDFAARGVPLLDANIPR